MDTASSTLPEILGRANEEELRGVLIALEGRVVDVVAVQESLAELRLQPSTRSTGGGLESPAAPAPAAVAVAAATAAKSSACPPSPPAPASKRARCGDVPPPDAAAAAASTAAEAETTTGNPSVNSSNSCEASAVVAVANEETSPDPEHEPAAAGVTGGTAATATTETGAAASLLAPSSAPPQGPRGLSWREKQRQKAAAAAERGAGGGGGGSKRQKKKGRTFDHSRWRKRTVALQLMYEGESYAGFCSQSDGVEDTVEKRLFHALNTTKLVETIATGDNYSRCGRTDKGVSALGNVVTVSMRSKFPKEIPDSELPTDPLGSLWVGPAEAEADAPAGGGEGRQEGAGLGGGRGGGAKAERQAEGQGNGGGGAKEAAVAAAAGGGPGKGEHALGRETGAPCIGTSGSVEGKAVFAASSVEGTAAVAASAAVVGAEQGGSSGGGSGGGNGSQKKKNKKGKKKNHMGGGSGGGAPPTGGEVVEIDYCGILNRVLPPDVRALAWAPVTEGFSARFSCSDRTYRYFFMARDMDIKAMDEAASKLVGNHDFRNFCKIDVANVSNFVRHIKHASVRPMQTPQSPQSPPTASSAPASLDYPGAEYYRICVFEVCGQAFLWHMVRCLMAVLFMVGRGLESPDVVSYLVDMERCPGKPHYDMAPDGPLLLHGCSFRSLDFQYTPENLYCLQAHLESMWEAAAIKAARLLNNLEFLAGVRVAAKDLDAFAAFKRALKGSNAEHYSVIDHGEQGRRREREQKQQEEEQRRQRQSGGGHGEGVTAPRGRGAAEGGGGVERVTWREALGHLRKMGLGPGQVLGRKGHMPMERRQQGLGYEELVEGLGGKKRERLDRHLSMKAAGEESGETDAFYNAAAEQGVPASGK